MKLESKPATNMLLYVVSAAVGATLMVLARDLRHGGTHVLGGFLLGALLALLGILGMLIGESRAVELDSRRRRIVLDVRRRIGSQQVIIPFAEIAGFAIGLQGKASAGTRYYDLVVRRLDGSELHLFGGCAFDGRMSREWIEGIRESFEREVSR